CSSSRNHAAGSVGAFPSRVRDVDDDAVRAGPFHLEIGVTAGRHRRVDMVLGGQPLPVRAFELGTSLVEIVDLKAKMMNAGEMRAVGAHFGRLTSLGVEDSHIDVAFGWHCCAVAATPTISA